MEMILAVFFLILIIGLSFYVRGKSDKTKDLKVGNNTYSDDFEKIEYVESDVNDFDVNQDITSESTIEAVTEQPKKKTKRVYKKNTKD